MPKRSRRAKLDKILDAVLVSASIADEIRGLFDEAEKSPPPRAPKSPKVKKKQSTNRRTLMSRK